MSSLSSWFFFSWPLVFPHNYQAPSNSHEEHPLASSCPSVSLSAPKHLYGSHWTDFCRHWGTGRLWNSLQIHICLKSVKYIENCTWTLNPLTPDDHYSGRNAPPTSKRCILYIYSTNIGTEYFKHGIYCPFFFSSKCSLFHNSNVFGSCFIHILYTGCAKIKKH